MARRVDDISYFWSRARTQKAPHDEQRTSLREVLHPQIGWPLCRIFALAGDTWPERVIAADLLHEDLGDNGGVNR